MNKLTDSVNLRNVAAIERFSSEHPNWILEVVRGVRGNTWWWLRDKANGQETRRVHATAARAAIRRRVFVRDTTWTDWRSTIYRRSQ